MTDLETACISWSKAGNNAEWTSPEIGAAYVINGAPSYVGGVFGQATDLNANSKYLSSVNVANGLNMNKGNIEMRLNLNGYDIVNGAPNGAANFNIQLDVHDIANGNRIWLAWWKGGGLFYQIADTSGASNWLTNDVDLDIPRNTWTHINFFWDNTEPVNKRQIWINGVMVASSNMVWGTTGNFNSATTYIGVQSGLNFTMNSGYDNPKFYNEGSNIITDLIANIPNEGFPSSGGFRLLDGGLNSPLLSSNMIN